MENINIKLDKFEGPFDLLFYLIEKSKIDLYDIPISSLTDQYLKYISNPDYKNMDNISEFILMASTLLEIKSRMLLPKPKIEDEEDIDPREELVNRLIEYKRYKEVANIFKEKEIFIDKVIFKKPEINLIEFLIEDKIISTEKILNGVTMDSLFNVFKDVISRREAKVDKVRSSFNSIKKDVFTVEIQTRKIVMILNCEKEILFSDIFNNESSKIEIVVTFLAILEMIKLKLIKIFQYESFGEIFITSTKEVKVVESF